MAGVEFGGSWTERKLTVLRKYLELYSRALRHSPSKERPFRRVYIDAFAGTGVRHAKRLASLPLFDLPELDAVTKGSARLALELEPPFDCYYLIELARNRASKLIALKTEFPTRSIEVINDDSNRAVTSLCESLDWRHTRGVVFLDPYGLQVSWQTLAAISRTRALDIWFLFPTGIGLNRLLTKSGQIPKEWRIAIDRILGTRDWWPEFYRVETDGDLFGEVRYKNVKDASAPKLERFIYKRLGTIFPFVWDQPVQLTNSKGQVMYLLWMMSANPSPKVRALATKLVRWAAKA